MLNGSFYFPQGNEKVNHSPKRNHGVSLWKDVCYLEYVLRFSPVFFHMFGKNGDKPGRRYADR